eukprot:CAMPEP_0113712160 /NCGR_PEP_ID=MMETSP0038_2-20120614/31222_1 /TAXON_ID=2898 /ORGANISM="Cryptomonas paramecium" /LENGTH=112 /DNA_ID=CAMNT_0000638625 /DNA_START=58 /DNA_END=393 /DNA_ORIENTATION=- /assembly_acc=CAM_ASM_000170
MLIQENLGLWLKSLGALQDGDLRPYSRDGRAFFELSSSAAESIQGGRAMAQALLSLTSSGAVAPITSTERDQLKQAMAPLRTPSAVPGSVRRVAPSERLYVWNALAPALCRA